MIMMLKKGGVSCNCRDMSNCDLVIRGLYSMKQVGQISGRYVYSSGFNYEYGYKKFE